MRGVVYEAGAAIFPVAEIVYQGILLSRFTPREGTRSWV
jgi:hypothetical protein